MTDRDSLQAGLDALATMEAAAVTLLGVARQRGQDGELDVGDDAVVILRAAQCQDEQHYHALAAGGLPVMDTFTIPEGMVTDRTPPPGRYPGAEGDRYRGVYGPGSGVGGARR